MKLTEGFVEYLKDVHAKQYMGSDDNMSDDFNNWLEKISGTAVVRQLKRFYEDRLDMQAEIQAMHAEEEQRKALELKY